MGSSKVVNRATSLRDDIAWVDVDVDELYGSGNSDNLATVLVSYFEEHLDKPEDSPVDDDRGGWSKWALDKTDAALDRIAAQAAAWAEQKEQQKENES